VTQPTPREVPVREAPAWPHRPLNTYTSTGPRCFVDDEPWPCPSQQYLDELVAALDEPPEPLSPSAAYGWEIARKRLLAILTVPTIDAP
jgi:hypothetical protein